jgi:polysaccharide export outer membrane protein
VKRTLSMMMMAGLLAGCATGDVPPLESAPPPVATTDFRLGPADKVRIIVFGEDNLSGEFSISPAGNVALPLIGEVRAEGQTPSALQRSIATKLNAGYIHDAHVSVEVLSYRPFYVLGEVNKPGVYPYEVGLTVEMAVATAQGYTYRANERQVFIKHVGDRQEHRYRIDSSTPVAPGDVVRVSERYF